MQKADQIKLWIQEIRTVRPVALHSIVLKSVNINQTSITLLDTACCIPALLINKPMEIIERADIEHFTQQINHRH